MKAFVLSCLALAACTDDLTLSETTYALASPGDDPFEEGSGCPEWGCGSNSPVMDALGFHELNEIGVPNLQGFYIDRFEKYVNGTWKNYRPNVTAGVLTAKSMTSIFWPPPTAWQGQDLVGMRFVIKKDAQTIHMNIVAVGHVTMWAQRPGVTRRRVPTYRFVSTGGPPDPALPVGVAVNVCGAAVADDAIPSFHAVLFENDRIDADAIEVVGEENNWFNIGCKGHALAKQHLLAHTMAGSALIGTTTTLDQRTANLKMITGDYCGKGDPFTVAGMPLKWRDANNWFDSIPKVANWDTLPPGSSPYDYTEYQIEARWTADGASCLNTPRVDWNQGSNPVADETFPDGVETLLDASAGWCTSTNPRPPPCIPTSAHILNGAHVISANAIL